MSSELSAHLSEEVMNDVLIGLSSPESHAHLAACAFCRSQLEEFRADMQLFNRTSLAWSEARSATMLRPAATSIISNAVLVRVTLVVATTVLAAVGLFVWSHNHRPQESIAYTHAVTPAVSPEDSEAQIEQDNDLMRSVDVALSSSDESPILEYHMSDGRQPRANSRPELRKP